MVTALCIEYGFVKEFGSGAGAAYAAFLQNLLMSVLFIATRVLRSSNEGQSLTIALNKWIGKLAPTIMFGLLGGSFSGPSTLILILGIPCSVFDLIYIWMLLPNGLETKPANDIVSVASR